LLNYIWGNYQVGKYSMGLPASARMPEDPEHTNHIKKENMG
jgi:hypothetical protein